MWPCLLCGAAIEGCLGSDMGDAEGKVIAHQKQKGEEFGAKCTGMLTMLAEEPLGWWGRA